MSRRRCGAVIRSKRASADAVWTFQEEPLADGLETKTLNWRGLAPEVSFSNGGPLRAGRRASGAPFDPDYGPAVTTYSLCRLEKCVNV
jgi:hypothetical protein